mgnify:CR=1 FL=1
MNSHISTFVFLILTLLFVGCVNQSGQENLPPQTTTQVQNNTVPAVQGPVGKDTSVATGAAAETARDILLKAKGNYSNAVYQVDYGQLSIFGVTNKVTDGRDGKQRFSVQTITDWSGVTYKKYLSNGNWFECRDECISSDDSSTFQISNTASGESATDDEFSGLKFSDKITTGKILGRDCDQIEFETASTAANGSGSGQKGEVTMCIDRELGIPLYFKVISGGIIIETQAEKVSTSFDPSVFEPKP